MHEGVTALITRGLEISRGFVIEIYFQLCGIFAVPLLVCGLCDIRNLELLIMHGIVRILYKSKLCRFHL